jgi:hypothetical protein
VTVLTRRLRSLLVALAVLALSAGVVLAGRPALSAPTRPDAAVTHTDGSDTETSETEETEPAEAPETESDKTDETETPETETNAPAADTSTAVHPDNHGKLVSEAAQGATPAGSLNHGQFVRTIAQDNHGHATATAATAKHPTKTH